MIPTFRPWTHPSDDSYIYQLSLVVGTATVSLQYSAVFVFWCADRIQYDVMGFHGLLALQHLTLTIRTLTAVGSISVWNVCDNTACIFLP